MRILRSLLVGVVVTLQVLASDHIDGPVTTSHRVADLTDLFAFPTPGASGSLTVILNAYPLVPRPGHFTDKVTYTVIVRRATIRNPADTSFFETSDEITLTCSFRTPNVTAEHVVMCRSSNGMRAESNRRHREETDEVRPMDLGASRSFVLSCPLSDLCGSVVNALAHFGRYLRAFGCDYAQGLIFARPVPSEEAGQMLATANRFAVVVE